MEKFYDIHGLLKIRAENLDLDRILSYFSVNTLSDPDLMIRIKRPNVNLNLYDRLGRFYLKNKEIIEKRKFGMVQLKDLFEKTKLNATSRYVRLRPFLSLIESVLWFKLLAKNHVFIHSAGISTDGEGCLISAWQGTGKTMVALKLVKEKGFSFLSDDAVIINDYGQAYCFPKNVKLSLSHAKEFGLGNKVKLKLLVGKLLNQVPVVRRRLHIEHIVPITKVIENAKIERQCKIDKMIMLQQASGEGVSEIDAREVAKRLTLVSQLEKIYWADHLFIAYAHADQDFDLQEIKVKERDIIQSALRGASCYEVRFRRYAYDQVEELLRS